jgi:hypothetical protein
MKYKLTLLPFESQQQNWARTPHECMQWHRFWWTQGAHYAYLHYLLCGDHDMLTSFPA